jgi:hypothetical protein
MPFLNKNPLTTIRERGCRHFIQTGSFPHLAPASYGNKIGAEK